MFDVNTISDMSFLRQSLLPQDLGKIRTEQKISWPFRRNIFYVTPVLRFNFFFSLHLCSTATKAYNQIINSMATLTATS